MQENASASSEHASPAQPALPVTDVAVPASRALPVERLSCAPARAAAAPSIAAAEQAGAAGQVEPFARLTLVRADGAGSRQPLAVRAAANNQANYAASQPVKQSVGPRAAKLRGNARLAATFSVNICDSDDDVASPTPAPRSPDDDFEVTTPEQVSCSGSDTASEQPTCELSAGKRSDAGESDGEESDSASSDASDVASTSSSSGFEVQVCRFFA